MLRDEAEEQTVAAAPHLPPPPAPTPGLQDEDKEDWGDLAKALEIWRRRGDRLTAEAEEGTVTTALEFDVELLQ